MADFKWKSALVLRSLVDLVKKSGFLQRRHTLNFDFDYKSQVQDICRQQCVWLCPFDHPWLSSTVIILAWFPCKWSLMSCRKQILLSVPSKKLLLGKWKEHLFGNYGLLWTFILSLMIPPLLFLEGHRKVAIILTLVIWGAVMIPRFCLYTWKKNIWWEAYQLGFYLRGIDHV